MHSLFAIPFLTQKYNNGVQESVQWQMVCTLSPYCSMCVSGHFENVVPLNSSHRDLSRDGHDIEIEYMYCTVWILTWNYGINHMDQCITK